MSTKHLLKFIALGFGLALSGAVLASPINVLWYTGGVDSDGAGGYQTSINTLAASQGWNITYWGSGAMPTGPFNVLVIASPEGGWSTFPVYTALNSAVPTFGDREMLTGQDADWHYINSPGPAAFDGPQGFLADSINWAGNGTGLGLVALGMDGIGCGATLGLTGFSSDCDAGTDNVQIPGPVAGYPVNAGLTSAGLSNWSSSAHVGFWDLSSAWTAINVDGDNRCAGAASGATCYVTILSAATAGGGTGTPVPEPAELGMFGLGLALIGLFAGLRRRAA